MRALWIFLAFSAQAQTNLDSLVAEALARNPMLHAIGHKLEAAEATVDQVGAWDPPQVGIEFFQVPVSSFPLPTKGNMEMDYFVRQTIPWPGKTLRMTRAADQAAKMQAHALRAMQLDLVRDVRNMYYELFLIDRKLEINQDARSLVRGLLTGVFREVEVGQGMQSQIWRLQSEAARLETDSLMLMAMRVRAEGDLNAMLNRDVTTPIRPDTSMALLEPVLDETELTRRALEARPELKSLDNMRQMFTEEKHLASRESYPNVMLEGMYKNMTGTSRDFWSLMIGVDIPFAPWARGRYRAKELESNEHIRHAEMEKVALEQNIQASIRRMSAEIRSAAGRVRISCERLIPFAQQAIQSVLADFQTGQATVSEVLERHGDLLSARKEYYENLADALRAMNELERVTGAWKGERHHD